MKRILISTVCAVCVASFAQKQARSDAEPQTRQAISASVCEIVKNGADFDGKYVSVHAFVVGGVPHGFALAEERCSGGLSMDAPESVRQHEDYLAFVRAVIRAGGGFSENSKSRLTATFCGLLTYHPKEHRRWVLEVERISDLELKPNASKSGER